MRTEDQIKSKLHELTELLQNCENELQTTSVKSQIVMLEWVIDNPTGAYHFEDME